MKTLSAHVTGFYRSSFHAYTTEVTVDNHRWRLGLRYSKFHEFYGQLEATASDFQVEFPPKGTLFFTPKPEERQEQLEVFLQQVLAYYAAKNYPPDIGALLCDLLKVPRHLTSREREDDDVSTSTESGIDEPIHLPPSSSNNTTVVDEEPKEEMPEVTEPNISPSEDVAPLTIALKDEEMVVATPESVPPVSPVAKEPIVTDFEAETEAKAPALAETANTVKETIDDDVHSIKNEDAVVDDNAARENQSEPVAATNAECEEEVAKNEDVAAEDGETEAEAPALAIEAKSVEETMDCDVDSVKNEESVKNEDAVVDENAAQENQFEPVAADTADFVECEEEVAKNEDFASEDDETKLVAATDESAIEAEIDVTLSVASIHNDRVEVAALDRLEESTEVTSEEPVTRSPPEPQIAEQPVADAIVSPNDNVEPEKPATSLWIATYLPKPVIRFIQRRCMKTTNFAILCIALLLPVVLTRK